MEGDIPLTLEGMSASAGNEQAASGAEGPAFNVLDDNHDTMWHTAWDGSERDVQWISISLGEARLVDGLRYLPRKSNENGLITKYEIYVSQDNGRTYQKACEGDWEADHSWKTAEFSPVMATDVKLQTVDALSAAEGKQFASAAEIRITTAEGEYEALRTVWEANSQRVKTEYTTETWAVFERAMQKAEQILTQQTADKTAVLLAKEALVRAADALKKAEIKNPDNPPVKEPEDKNPQNPAVQNPVTAQQGKHYRAGNYFYRVTSAKKQTVQVTGAAKASIKTIAVPAKVTLYGTQYKVTAIADGAFKNNQKASFASIGKYVETIGKKAFWGCKSLKKITIQSKKLKKAGKNAFWGIHKNAKIKVPASKFKKYQNLLKNKGQGKQVKIKK